MKTLILVLLLSTASLARAAAATPPSDDHSGATAPPATASSAAATQPTSDAPSDLTDREKWMVQRIEKLERRLAEMEGGKAPEGGLALAAAVPAPKAPPVPLALQGSQEVPRTPLAPATREAERAPFTAKPEPFAFADFTWLTGNSRQKDFPLDGKVFSGEVRVDTAYSYSLNHPKDDTIGGSTEVFRHNEIQLTDFGIGGDFHWQNLRARLLTQYGMYSQTQPRNDASPGKGQYNLDNAFRYIGEAYGGYHIDTLNGINVDAGLFLSYIGLYSFYQFDNWAYQPSYVSSNTPWYFMGARVQIYTSDKLKIEPWLINGWQSYGKFNKAPGVGGQILWRPNGSISVVSNNYWGTDTLGISDRKRVHTDNSIQVKYLDRPGSLLDKAAFSVTLDAGCEYGGGVSCSGGAGKDPAQYFLGFMVYNRFWFWNDQFGLTLGGGEILNPGRYLVILPPINGATSFSGTPYFTAAPGDPFKAWDASITFDYMPTQFTTFRAEYNHRVANVPYFSGPGGVTPLGGNTGPPGSLVDGFTPDLVKTENRFTLGLLVKL
ncbi:MAG: outer membrane beta-barrel protein [Thermoanaerobaculia bacterium]